LKVKVERFCHPPTKRRQAAALHALARMPGARSIAKRLERAGSAALCLSPAQPQRNARGVTTALVSGIQLCHAALRYVMREMWRVRRR